MYEVYKITNLVNNKVYIGQIFKNNSCIIGKYKIDILD